MRAGRRVWSQAVILFFGMAESSRKVTVMPLYLTLVAILASSSLIIRPCHAQCNTTAGSWVQAKSPLYATSKAPIFGSCSARSNRNYLSWQWVAPGCTIRRVDQDPQSFLKAMSNKKMLIAGDSIAKNLFSALLWSMPTSLPSKANLTFASFSTLQYKGIVSCVWSPFLTTYANQTGPTGNSKAVNLDIVDPAWKSSLMDSSFLVILGFRHFFHKAVTFYKKGKLLANYDPNEAVRDVSTLILQYVQKQKYKGTVIVFTFPPSHPDCYSSYLPYTSKQMKTGYRPQVSNIIKQVFANAGSQFKIIDITYLSAWRPDAHPGVEVKASPDCSHWCVPGVPNTWVDILSSTVANSLVKK